MAAAHGKRGSRTRTNTLLKEMSKAMVSGISNQDFSLHSGMLGVFTMTALGNRALFTLGRERCCLMTVFGQVQGLWQSVEGSVILTSFSVLPLSVLDCSQLTDGHCCFMTQCLYNCWLLRKTEYLTVLLLWHAGLYIYLCEGHTHMCVQMCTLTLPLQAHTYHTLTKYTYRVHTDRAILCTPQMSPLQTLQILWKYKVKFLVACGSQVTLLLQNCSAIIRGMGGSL